MRLAKFKGVSFGEGGEERKVNEGESESLWVKVLRSRYGDEIVMGRGLVTMDKDDSISSLGEWRNNNLKWRSLFLLEQAKVNELLKILEAARLEQDTSDG
ncbi:hypothetical protein Lal_00003768 [Lupinus albus]|nr:hypothetical protein Lal_00003768 [Lupinus albus]